MEYSKKAIELLQGEKAHSLWGDMGIRESEHDGISHERLIEFVKSYPVKGISVGNNNYGRFMFVSLEVHRKSESGNKWVECLQFWGNGYHERRGVLMVNWDLNVGNGFLLKDKQTIEKRLAVAQINDYRLSQGIGVNTKQRKSGNLFEFIADLTDDDFASVYMDEI